MRRAFLFGTFSLLLFLLLLQGLTAGDQPESSVALRRGPETWQALMEEPRSRGLIPGALLLVKGPAWGTRLVTVGAADLGDGRPMTVDSLFRVGPLTKTMVAVALLQQETEWRVRLDQTLSALLGDGIVPGAEQITLRDILFQTSGVYSYRNLPEFSTTGEKANDSREFLPEEIVALAVQAGKQEPSRSPGTFFPSDTDAILAGLIAQATENKPLGELLENRVFKQAGLKNTYFDSGREVPEGMVRGYTGCLPDVTPRDRTLRNPSADWAAGAVVSTPRDVLTFMETLFQSRRLLTQHGNAWLFKYLTDWNGTPENARGAGVMERVSIRGTFRGVEGFIPGYALTAGYYLHGETYILLFINTSDNPLMVKELYDSLLRQITGAPNRMLPADGATVDEAAVTLSWAAGLLYGDEYHVYVGTDLETVSRATVEAHEGVQLFRVDGKTYEWQVKGLTSGKSHFWRVDTHRNRPPHEMDNLRKRQERIYQAHPVPHDPLIAEEEIISGPVFRFEVD